MKHFTSPRFWKCYDALPEDVRALADACFLRLKDNPRHPSIQFKRIGDLWSARVGLHYRTLGMDVPGGVMWVWIGPHAEYDTILRG